MNSFKAVALCAALACCAAFSACFDAAADGSQTCQKAGVPVSIAVASPEPIQSGTAADYGSLASITVGPYPSDVVITVTAEVTTVLNYAFTGGGSTLSLGLAANDAAPEGVSATDYYYSGPSGTAPADVEAPMTLEHAFTLPANTVVTYSVRAKNTITSGSTSVDAKGITLTVQTTG